MTTTTEKNPSTREQLASHADGKHSKDSGFRAFDSDELFQGCKEIRISHEGREYRLRVTRLNKLIMTV